MVCSCKFTEPESNFSNSLIAVLFRCSKAAQASSHHGIYRDDRL